MFYRLVYSSNYRQKFLYKFNVLIICCCSRAIYKSVAHKYCHNLIDNIMLKHVQSRSSFQCCLITALVWMQCCRNGREIMIDSAAQTILFFVLICIKSITTLTHYFMEIAIQLRSLTNWITKWNIHKIDCHSKWVNYFVDRL